MLLAFATVLVCVLLQVHYLQSFFQSGLQIASQAAGSGAALTGEDGGACGAAMGLMSTILSWDFKGVHAANHTGDAAAVSDSMSKCYALVQ